MSAKVISIYNLKGGTGKTTLTLALGYFSPAVRQNLRILLIDLDQQANLTASALPSNVFQEMFESKRTVARLFDEKVTFDPHELVYHTFLETTDIVPSALELASREFEAFRLIDGKLRIKLFVDQLKDEYDLIVIDTPPAWNVFSWNALYASDYLIMPTAPNFWSIEGTRVVMELLEPLLTSPNYNLQLLGFVVNFVDKRYKAHKSYIEYLQHTYGSSILGVLGKRTLYENLSLIKDHLEIFKLLNDAAAKDLFKVLENIFTLIFDEDKSKQQKGVLNR